MTSPSIVEKHGHELDLFLNVCIIIFAIEILIKILVYWRRDKEKRVLSFFGTWENKDYWNIFDACVTFVSLFTFSSFMEHIVGIRTLRLLKLINIIKPIGRNSKFRTITEAMFSSIPLILGTFVYFVILFIVYAIIGINLYRETNPEYFGNIWIAFYSLFQVMTLDNWIDVSNAVFKFHSRAPIYFITFIIFAAYLLWQVIVGIIVRSLNEAREKNINKEQQEIEDLLDDVQKLSEDCCEKYGQEEDYYMIECIKELNRSVSELQEKFNWWKKRNMAIRNNARNQEDIS